jgi:hypothetical protein
VKLVDAGDSKSPDPRGHVGSIPTSGTSKNKGLRLFKALNPFLFCSASSILSPSSPHFFHFFGNSPLPPDPAGYPPTNFEDEIQGKTIDQNDLPRLAKGSKWSHAGNTKGRKVRPSGLIISLWPPCADISFFTDQPNLLLSCRLRKLNNQFPYHYYIASSQIGQYKFLQLVFELLACKYNCLH